MTRGVLRTGVLGGTFDPVHVGHLILAEEAASRLKLDRVLFLPAAQPPHKRARGVASAEHRLAMLRLAIRGNPHFEVSRLEIDRGGVSFTAETLEALARRGGGELYFIMGQDSLEEFPSWRNPEQITRLARLAVFPRGDRDTPSLPPALRRRVTFLHPPRIGISSTEIRRRIRRGLSVRYWIPDPVLGYVMRHGLYGSRAGR
ncbi:MAG: nicotinate-nucleotide adenylyltransferase [Candidatus Eiseniibacteriota bacterium]